MYREGLVPGVIVSSPVERARQTTQSLCKALDLDHAAVVWDETIYDANVEALLATLGRAPGDVGTVLVVGHKRGLKRLLTYLAGDDLDGPSESKAFPPATLAQLEMPENWSNLQAGCGQLVGIRRRKSAGLL